MASLEQLRELCRYRELDTRELYPNNEHYGRAALLKKYCGLEDHYQLKAVVENFRDFGSRIFSEDLESELPAIFVFAEEQIPRLRKHYDKPIYPIGPLINYTESLLSSDQLEEERERLGKNLLYIASFSSELCERQVDVHSLCRTLQDYGRDFNSVRVCLHWKDVQSDLAERIAGCGFELVSPGHTHDPLFLPRLRSILEASTVVAASSICVPVGYAVLLDVPMFLMAVEEYRSELVSSTSLNEAIQFWSLFHELRSDISLDQRKLVNRLWGLESVKTPEELKAILDLTEEAYQKTVETYEEGSQELDREESTEMVEESSPTDEDAEEEDSSLEEVEELEEFVSDKDQQPEAVEEEEAEQEEAQITTPDHSLEVDQEAVPEELPDQEEEEDREKKDSEVEDQPVEQTSSDTSKASVESRMPFLTRILIVLVVILFVLVVVLLSTYPLPKPSRIIRKIEKIIEPLSSTEKDNNLKTELRAVDDARKKAEAILQAAKEVRKEAEAKLKAAGEAKKKAAVMKEALEKAKGEAEALRKALEKALEKEKEKEAAWKKAKKEAGAREENLKKAKENAEAMVEALENAKREAEAREKDLKKAEKKAAANIKALKKAKKKVPKSEAEKKEQAWEKALQKAREKAAALKKAKEEEALKSPKS